MTKYLKRIFKNMTYLILGLFPHDGALVLMYHSIGDEEGDLSPKEFEKQLGYIKEMELDVISADDLFEGLNNRGKFNSKVVLTFDDGYENNYTQVFPLLKKYNMEASIFLVTGSIGGQNQKRNGKFINMLNEYQIKEMSESNLVRFYPHSHNHLKLTKLRDNEAMEEIKKSQNSLLENNLGKADIFAYPFGRVNSSLKSILKALGFKGAFGITSGRVKENDDVFEIKRNAIDENIDFKTFKKIVHFQRL